MISLNKPVCVSPSIAGEVFGWFQFLMLIENCYCAVSELNIQTQECKPETNERYLSCPVSTQTISHLGHCWIIPDWDVLSIMYK